MGKFKYISALFIALIISASTYAQNQEYFIHTVNKGQTLFSLSRMYETTVQAIVDLNPGCDKVLSIGQKLKIPQKKNSEEDNFKYHTIAKGETIYSLSKKYDVTLLDICAANPGINVSSVREGEVIRIPKKVENKVEEVAKESVPEVKADEEVKIKTTHKVRKGETIYSICYIYGITEEEFYAVNPELRDKKLKKGKKVNIPYHTETKKESVKESEQPKMDETQEKDDKYRFINHVFPKKSKVAIILPFMLDKYSKQMQLRMVEFYEGFLLAVKEQKEKGHSYEINTFDSGDESSSLDSLIRSGSLDDMNLIIGAGYNKHNKELAAFAKSKGIHLVIPFTGKEEEIYNNPMVYVVNSQQSYITPEIAEQFAKTFPNANPIIVSDEENNQKEIVDALKKDFEKRGIEYSVVSIEKFTDPDTYIGTLRELIKEDKQNVVIPSSKKSSVLSKILPIVVSARSLEEKPIENLSLFGYPEWQMYASNLGDMLYKADTYFYATFFSHNSMPEVAQLQNKYLLWYNRTMQDSHPRYGILGYDIGNYFLSAISTKGAMPEGTEDLGYTPIQTDFKFERVNNWGGFLNKKVFIIHFTPDYYIEKIDFDKQDL